MMKLESQVCTLAQAKRLKELGVKQESLFYWSTIHFYSNGGYYDAEYQVTDSRIFSVTSLNDNIYSAFTVAELGAMLPDVYERESWATISDAGNDKNGTNLEPPNTFSLFVGESVDSLRQHPILNWVFATEAEARAAYLIHLIESNSLTVENKKG